MKLIKKIDRKENYDNWFMYNKKNVLKVITENGQEIFDFESLRMH